MKSYVLTAIALFGSLIGASFLYSISNSSSQRDNLANPNISNFSFPSAPTISSNSTSYSPSPSESLPHPDSPSPCPSQANRSYRAAIFYLVHTSSADLADFRASLRCLNVNFNVDPSNCPVVIWHEGLSIEEQIEFQAVSKFTLEFILIKMEFPPNFEQAHVQPPKFEKRGAWAYNHMIRFWFVKIFEHPRLKKLDYYLRLDSDSHITTPFDRDPFLWMQQNQILYAYRSENADGWDVTAGLWDFVAQFEQKYNINPNQLPIQNSTIGFPQYYNNFEIVDLNWYLGHEGIKKFTKEVDESLSIYRVRWGDGPLRYAVTNLYLNESQRWKYEQFGYQHQSNVWC